ncbi:MAG TPA: response regulator [Bryobacteraceae bacterium]|nr:response regulator [Bryobacteraceae bacterium]
MFILLIQKNPAETALIRSALAQMEDTVVHVQCVESLATALARIGGGGVDLILMDLSLQDDGSNDPLSGFLQMQKAASPTPIIVLYAADEEGLALRAMRAGATDYLLKERYSDGVASVMRTAMNLGRKRPEHRNSNSFMPSPQLGGVISFIGAKGGVGVTTVALNVACVLAKTRKVILVELSPAFGTLQPYLKPYGQLQNTSHLLRTEATQISPAAAVACLWPCNDLPNLRLLFGPQTAAECGDLRPDRVKQLITALLALADYVILDLPASLSEANRAAIEDSGRLLLVMERDPNCTQSAKLMARALEAWDGTPQIETILVNRTLVSCPVPLPEIEAEMGFPVLGMVPPAPDICLAAQRAHAPLTVFQPDCLIAESLAGLADKCASSARTLTIVA